jgi:transposase
MKPYSVDLRRWVVDAVQGGLPRAEAVRVFAVSLPTMKRRRETGDLAPRPVPGPAPVKTAGLPEALPERLAARPDATLAEHCGPPQPGGEPDGHRRADQHRPRPSPPLRRGHDH